MSTLHETQTTFIIRLLARFIGSAGLATSLLAMSLTWLIPTLKTGMPRYCKSASLRHRRRHSMAVNCRSVVTNNKSSYTVAVEDHPLPARRPTNGRHVSFTHESLQSSKQRTRNFRSSSYNYRDSDSSNSSPRSSRGSSDSTSSDACAYSTDSDVSIDQSSLSIYLLPKMKKALSSRRRRATEKGHEMVRSRTTPHLHLSDSKASVKSDRKTSITFTNPWPMSRSLTTETKPAETQSKKQQRPTLARGVSITRPKITSHLSSPSTYFSRQPSQSGHHEMAYSSYLRRLSRFGDEMTFGRGRSSSCVSSDSDSDSSAQPSSTRPVYKRARTWVAEVASPL